MKLHPVKRKCAKIRMKDWNGRGKTKICGGAQSSSHSLIELKYPPPSPQRKS